METVPTCTHWPWHNSQTDQADRITFSRIFWHTIERDFTDARGTTWHGKDFEQKMEREEDSWLEECENQDPEKKRRRGHEEGSNYDKLMKKWHGIWNKMLKKHWQFMVDSGEEKLEFVPEEFKKDIKIPAPRYEYDGAKLERVVHAAMERATATGKPDLAAAVEQVYKDALQDTKLRNLLELILTQKADRVQNEEFQKFVRQAKTKIREAKEQKLKQDQLDTEPAGSAPPDGVTPVLTATGSEPSQAHTAATAVAPASMDGASSANVVAAPVTPVVVTVATAAVPAAARPAVAPSAQLAVVSPADKATKAKASTKAPIPATQSISPAAKSFRSKVPSNDAVPVQAVARPRKSVDEWLAESDAPPSTTAATTQVKSPSQVRDHATPNPRIAAILGELCFAETAQQILKAAPNIDDSRLQALKSTLTEYPETKTDFVALCARLEKESSSAVESQASALSSRPHRSTAGKRRRTLGGTISMAEAEESDLLNAERAAKRRRGEAGKDDGGDYHPLKAVRDKSQKKRKTSGAHTSKSLSVDTSISRDSSQISELTDEVDIESTKSAYVDEIVRRRNDEQARKAIVERYGPVSPTDAGDVEDDWASMASPTLGAAQFDDEQMRIDDGAVQLDDRVPSPPPEPAPAVNDPLRLISGATAQAIARDPGINRLEAKLDTLITSRAASDQTANDINVANTAALKDIATGLGNDVDLHTRPELLRLIAQLTRNAAEVAIHSAEAAKKAAEMARDVSLILQHTSGIKAAGEHPATPISEN